MPPGILTNSQHQANRHQHKDKPVNDWSNKTEKLLRYWQEECRLYNWLYIQNVETYKQVNKVMSIVSILLSSITGTTLLNQSGETNDKRLLVGFGIVSLLASVVSSVKEFMDLGAKINANINCARQNSCIVNDIDEQMNLPRDDRINGREFMKQIKDRKNELIQNGPLIPRSKWDKLQKQINSGQGINFLNKKLFQEYLDQSIVMNDVNFHLDNEHNSPDNSPDIVKDDNNKSNYNRISAARQTNSTLAPQSQQQPTNYTYKPSFRTSDETHVTIVEPAIPLMRSSTNSPNNPNNNDALAFNMALNSNVPSENEDGMETESVIAYSEDEYINNMNDQNLCTDTIRTMLNTSTRGDIEEPVSPDRPIKLERSKSGSGKLSALLSNSFSPAKKNKKKPQNTQPPEAGPVNKYNTLLQYQLTRL
jgi:hypothetical protein